MDDRASQLVSLWGIPAPFTVTQLSTGASNQTLLVDTHAGTYILRRTVHGADAEQLATEQAILVALQHAQLPFAVPQPMPTVDGRMIVTLPTGNGLAMLSPRLPGQARSVIDEHVASAAGATLGVLTRALADLSGVSRPAFNASIDSSTALPVDTSRRQRVTRLIERLAVAQRDLAVRLPTQVIHADYDPSNVLFEDDHVSGVLDFEFAGHAPRAMDLAVAIHGFAGQPSGTPHYWSIIDAFARGYGQHVAVTDDELMAIPDLMRIRQAISVSLRVAHGARADDLANRVDRLLRLDDVLTLYGDELSRRVASNLQRGKPVEGRCATDSIASAPSCELAGRVNAVSSCAVLTVNNDSGRM